MLGDPKGVTPSNVDQGYVLRRLIRRAVRYGKMLGLNQGDLAEISICFIEKYKNAYPELLENKEKIITELNKEEEKFSKALTDGLKEFNKVVTYIQGNIFPGKTAFRLFDTFGFPLELTQEMADERGYKVDAEGFKKAFELHQQKSHSVDAGVNKGGLAEQNEQTTRLHTATHIMLAGLKKIFGEQVNQKGSNITPERLRFDFNLDHKMTEEEIKELEVFVNNAIERKLPVHFEEMTVEEAKNINAVGVFDSKYGEKVKVYFIGDVDKQICGGPHVKNTE